MKYRELCGLLREAGCQPRQGKGSHEVWEHPSAPGRRVVTLCGNDGVEAKKYQVARVRKFRKGMMVYE